MLLTVFGIIQKGGKIVLACRDLKKANEACHNIKLETNSENVFVMHLDLSSFESIREFVKEFRAKFTRLDILINNAGLFEIYTKIDVKINKSNFIYNRLKRTR